MTYFEWNVGNFGQAIAIPAVPLPTVLLLFYTESEKWLGEKLVKSVDGETGTF